MLTDFSFYGNIIAMKKIKLFSSLFLLTALFFSCSNASTSKIITSDGNNLREAIQNKESSVNWTKPLEENRLSEPIDKNDKLTTAVRINPEITTDQEYSVPNMVTVLTLLGSKKSFTAQVIPLIWVKVPIPRRPAPTPKKAKSFPSHLNFFPIPFSM